MLRLAPDRPVDCVDLGLVAYAEALGVQERLHGLRRDEAIFDTLLFLEHPPVVTLGKRGVDGDLLLPPDELRRRGYDLHRVDRGGQATYHGPGQLVVYFIVNLYQAQRELRLFVETLEESLIDYLGSACGLSARIVPEHPGVWVGDEKVAALGITVRHRVTMHGLALNVDCDLDRFSAIVPCGIRDKGVASIASLAGRAPAMADAKTGLAAVLARHFGYAGARWTALP